MSPGRSVRADSLGVGVATGAYGISFGALATASGLDVWQACALSLLVFTGASQFAFVGVIASGGAPLAGAATSVLLGSRNLFYGPGGIAYVYRAYGLHDCLNAIAGRAGRPARRLQTGAVPQPLDQDPRPRGVRTTDRAGRA